MAIKVFFIAKILDLNNEYQEFSSELRNLAEQIPGFVDITSETIGDTEITVSTWRDRDAVAQWARHPLHQQAKQRSAEWYSWVRGIHVETVNE